VKKAFQLPLFLLMLFSLVLSSCSQAGTPTNIPVGEQPTIQAFNQAEEQPLPEAEITFGITIPPGTSEDDSVTINILDEVSGLALNALTYPMDAGEDGKYSATLKFPVGSVVKYRYARHTSNSTLQEHTSDGRPVRYRLYHV
jgi:hypothetical protein